MEEQKNKLTDRQLAGEMRKGRRGGAGGKLLIALGAIVVLIGIIMNGSIPVVIVGVLIAGLGEWLKSKSKGAADQQVYDNIVPDVVNAVFDNVQMDPTPHLLDVKDTNIPLPDHTYCSGSGYVRGTYQGLTAELCTVTLTDANEVQREETGLWEKNEQVVYAGQWMLCELGREFPTWLTIWPRGKLDKLFNSRTIKTENEDFNKKFNLSSDDEQEALRILNPSRMERLMKLAETSGKFALNLNTDGRLYIAAHCDRGFFDPGKGREKPDALRQRYTRELKWFTEVIDTFRPL